MATDRTERLFVRVTPSEKAAMMTAAGGPRQMSEWLRALALQAVSYDRLASAPLPDPNTSPGGGAAPAAPAPPAPPKKVGKKAARVAGQAKEAAERTAAADSGCPRWMHHRPGTYCGSCKTVPS